MPTNSPTLADINAAIAAQSGKSGMSDSGPSLADVQAAIQSHPDYNPAQQKLIDSAIGNPNVEKQNISGNVLSPNDFTKPGEMIPKEGGIKNFIAYNAAHFQPMNRNNLLGAAAMSGGITEAAAPQVKVNMNFLKAKDPLIQEIAGTGGKAGNSAITGISNIIKNGKAGLPEVAQAAKSNPEVATGVFEGLHHLGYKDLAWEFLGHSFGLPPGAVTALKKVVGPAIMKGNNALLPAFQAEAGALPRALIPAGAALQPKGSDDE